MIRGKYIHPYFMKAILLFSILTGQQFNHSIVMPVPDLSFHPAIFYGLDVLEQLIAEAIFIAEARGLYGEKSQISTCRVFEYSLVRNGLVQMEVRRAVASVANQRFERTVPHEYNVDAGEVGEGLDRLLEPAIKCEASLVEEDQVGRGNIEACTEPVLRCGGTRTMRDVSKEGYRTQGVPIVAFMVGGEDGGADREYVGGVPDEAAL